MQTVDLILAPTEEIKPELRIEDITRYLESVDDNAVIGTQRNDDCLGARALRHKYTGHKFWVEWFNCWFITKPANDGPFTEFSLSLLPSYSIPSDVREKLDMFDALVELQSNGVTKEEFLTR